MTTMSVEDVTEHEEESDYDYDDVTATEDESQIDEDDSNDALIVDLRSNAGDEHIEV